MAGKWATGSSIYGRWGVSRRINDRIRISMEISNYPQGFWSFGERPPGVYSGRWFGIGPFWVRLGRRRSWRDEDLEAEMIEPVEPS
jgi:hypothetical protein